MIIRLGYACISKTIEGTCSTPYTYTDFLISKDYDKLNNIIISNLEQLENLIIYNIKNNIHFFRISSKLIPLATKDDISFEYIKPYQNYYNKISDLISKHDMRVDFHPDQFCVLNSTRKEVIENTIEILKYHYNILEALHIKDKILVLHIGSNVFGKEKAILRFVNQFKKLPDYLKKCIAIENDDKIFNIDDCLLIAQKLDIPIVLDYHHYKCNHNNENIPLEEIIATWKNKTPKMHFSSPKNKTKKEIRSHHEYINSDDFISFLETIKYINTDIDIMIEAKGKDDALFRLIRELKYKTNYQFIDDTSFYIT